MKASKLPTPRLPTTRPNNTIRMVRTALMNVHHINSNVSLYIHSYYTQSFVEAIKNNMTGHREGRDQLAPKTDSARKEKSPRPPSRSKRSGSRSRAGSAEKRERSHEKRHHEGGGSGKNHHAGGGGGGKKSRVKAAGSDTTIRVAVRVRPFLEREQGKGVKCIIDMQGNQTKIKNPKGGGKDFAFDFSYWSHDGYKDDGNGYLVPDSSHPNGGKYANQQKVFEDLGEDVLANAWAGYNSTLFAYGQTGSGKSYSVVGYGVNKGIVPVFCERLFEEIANQGGDGFTVTFSMIEIYNEVVRDLLNPNSDKKKGLKIREHSSHGFYAQGLTTIPVKSMKQIDSKIKEGTKNRSIAATKMNETSSRAHTIVSITFLQKGQTTRSSVTHLVDLAGSERNDRTGSTGDRLKEGASINLSLTSLGKCIMALADNTSGKNTKVPFRDSVLTKLLMNALGGNSKTVMVAAISPSDIDYEESLSTLRYADRAKKIKTKATVNESDTDKLIRELQEEIARLKEKLAGGGATIAAASVQENDLAELEEDNKQMMMMAGTLQEDSGEDERSQEEAEEEKKKTPYLYNVSEDAQLTGMIVHFIQPGSQEIGKSTGIALYGEGVKEKHAVLVYDAKKKVAMIKAGKGAEVYVNGKPIKEEVKLDHDDRIRFGTTQTYVFCHHEVSGTSPDRYEFMTWDRAQAEIEFQKRFYETESKKK